MTKIIETEGIEKAVIYSWKGWDGDISYATFSGVVLQPSVEAYLLDQGLDLSLHLFVTINMDTCTAEISAYSEFEDEPQWERKFDLKVSIKEIDDYTASQKYSL